MLLQEWRSGDQNALHKLAPAVEIELKRLAGSQMRRERPEHTLQPTALVNEVYLRLIRQNQPDWQNRAHFLAVAAVYMRQILVDHARSRMRDKRGSGAHPLSLTDATLYAPERSTDLLALDEALREMVKFDPRKAKIVELYFFGGMKQGEIAEALAIHVTTVARDLRLAQAWLRNKLEA